MNRVSRSIGGLISLFCFSLLFQFGCGTPETQQTVECNSDPIVMKTSAGVEFVRTPESCFKDIPDFPYEPKYVEIDGLRQAYVEDGPADGQVVLLLHGQPSWSYLYRKMIPVLAKAGYRAIAMDHMGMGRSDKPIQVKEYTYLGHIDRLEKFIQKLGLKDITLFCQDWGSLIGLHVAGKHPDWFARIVVGNGALPVIPAGTQPFPPVENPDQINNDLKSSFNQIPAQQVSFYDDNCKLAIPGGSGNNSGSGVGEGAGDFGAWIRYAMTAGSFKASEVLEALTWFDLPDSVEAAYDAPFPSRIYMAGPRTFPSLVNQTPGQNDTSWKGLTSFTKPVLTIWAANDPGNLGQCATQDNLICNIPGAKGQPHTRLPKASHFLQDDQGAEIARLMVDFMSKSPTSKGDYQATCGETQPNPTLPVTSDGTGTPCKSDDDCSSLKAAKKCLKMGSSQGFCTVEGCKVDSCGDNYACCRECNPALASMLPFKDSACFPAAATSALTGQAGCTCGKKTDGKKPDDPKKRVGYEILQMKSPTEIVTWISFDITQKEFDAIQLPQGWFKNQPREGMPASSEFLKSPNATKDGEFVEETHFGHKWRHVATVVNTQVKLDDEGLLKGSQVKKFHKVTYNKDQDISILVSPKNERYILISRDAGRTTDTHPVPKGWQLLNIKAPQTMTIPLLDITTVIRAKNEDSYQGPLPSQQGPTKFRGERFCEVLLGFPKDGGKIELKIYNTFGLNDCPKAEWEALDSDKIKADNKAAVVVLNGPRFWTMDAIKATGTSPNTETKTFGALKMRLGGTIVIDAKDVSSMNNAKPYTESVVNRETEYTFNAGEMIFQLTSPKQEVYTMQTFSHEVESDLTLSNLAQLDTRLKLPDGWSFKATTLTDKLVLTAKGQATLVRDSFQNTYQKNE